MAPTAAPVVRATLEIDGRAIETARWGDPAAPTLVLLHEGLGCVELWRDVPETLAAWTGWSVLAYSRFGYGRSHVAAPPWGPDYMHREAIDVLPRILDAARVGRHALIGHSDGGTIAAIAAGARDDPALAGIVLIAAHFFVEDMNLSAIAAIQESYAQGDLRRRLGRYHDDPDAAFMGWSGAWLDPAFRSLDLSRYLAAIRAPVLGLQGADDPYGTEAQLEFLSAHTRVRTETRLIDGARHAPHLEAKNPTLAAITGFVLDLTP